MTFTELELPRPLVSSGLCWCPASHLELYVWQIIIQYVRAYAVCSTRLRDSRPSAPSLLAMPHAEEQANTACRVERGWCECVCPCAPGQAVRTTRGAHRSLSSSCHRTLSYSLYERWKRDEIFMQP